MYYKFTLFFCFLVFAFQINAQILDGRTDSFFLTGNGFDDEVRDIALQTDGRLVIAGEFTNIAGVPRGKIARLETSGNLDPTLNPGTGANGNILVVKLYSDNKILIAGEFTSYNGTPINRIARLNSDGTLDTTFNPGTGASFTVNSLAVQSDNKIIVGGIFPTFNGVNTYGIIRLNFDGSIDQTFTSPLDNTSNSAVNAVALQSDGKILIGGNFTTPGNAIRRIARLESDGRFDSTFQTGTGANGSVNTITVQPDGRILLAGNFSTINSVSKPNMARLLGTGELDADFTTQNTNGVLKIVLQPDGKILICGLSVRVKRLNTNGSDDLTFQQIELGGGIYSIVLMPDGKIIGGGVFSRIAGVGGAGPGGVRKYNIDGTRDNTFVTAVGGAEFYVNKLKIQQDNKILLVGEFSEVGGLVRPRVARLNADGSVDAAFSPTINAVAAAPQPDGKVVIAEKFRTTENFRLHRFNQDGTIDPTFSANTGTSVTGEPTVNDITVQSDGKIIVVGSFTTVNGTARPAIVRLNTDGSIDTSFTPNIILSGYTGNITAHFLMPSGQIMIAGMFQNPLGGGTLYRIFRLNSNGIADPVFGFLQPNNFIRDIAVQPDGKVLVCGGFTMIDVTPSRFVARINANGTFDTSFNPPQIDFFYVSAILPQQNSKVIIGGEFTTIGGISRPRIARLNANGSLDTSFNVSVTGSNSPSVNTIKQQSDGKIIIGGWFTNVNGFFRFHSARLLNTPKTSFTDFDGDGKTDLSIFRPSAGEWWYARSSDGGNRAFQFGASTDRIVPADFTGDGKTDIAVWRPENGTWYILRSEDLSFYAFPFGAAGDTPVPADYDGDGKADAAVFRESSLTWFIQKSSGGTDIIGFGAAGDKPVVADYDGDGKADIAIYRPNGANGAEWWIRRSSDAIVFATQFGTASDKPMQGDFTGDGKADVAFFRPSNGTWYVLRSEDFSFYAFPFGASGDMPVAGDYDGDGKFDAGVFRPSNSTWFVNRSTAGTLIQTFGVAGDLPVPNAFVP